MSEAQTIPTLRKPDWIRAKLPGGENYHATRRALRARGLVSVCEEARCPNIAECWAKRHATFMILGDICTRACAFCNVATGKPRKIDAEEPQKIAEAAAELNLSHIVITSVDRDDLADGGAGHFAQTVSAIRAQNAQATIECLTPDFRNKPDALDILFRAPPDVFNHNMETVERLYKPIRPGARYENSLRLLSDAKKRLPGIFTKSGLMVGLGETDDEIFALMDDMRAAHVDFITIGQYLQPTPRHAPVLRFVPPATFDTYAEHARAQGFLMVKASPFTRSSYHAEADFARLRQIAKSA